MHTETEAYASVIEELITLTKAGQITRKIYNEIDQGMRRDLILERSEKERVNIRIAEELEVGKHERIKITFNQLSS